MTGVADKRDARRQQGLGDVRLLLVAHVSWFLNSGICHPRGSERETEPKARSY